MKKKLMAAFLLICIVLIYFLLNSNPEKPSASTTTTQVEQKIDPSMVPSNFVLVKGGTILNKFSKFYNKGYYVNPFYMGVYEVTQKEWMEVMGYNPSKFKGDNLPVESVSWYESIEYCNKRSLKEGLQPCYRIEKDKIDVLNISEYDSIKWVVTINQEANGYRLPTELEWEYAADGGHASAYEDSCNCITNRFSGSNDIEEVAWYWRNSGDTYLRGNWFWPVIEDNHCMPHPIGGKLPNELGIYDMSGNVREWCWDKVLLSSEGYYAQRVWKGGGWMGSEESCEISYQGRFEASGKGPDQGLRLILPY